MEKIIFKDLPDTSTPIDAETLNTMQDNIETAINNVEPPTIVIDTEMSDVSTNPVQNKIIKEYVDGGVTVLYTNPGTTMFNSGLEIADMIDYKFLVINYINFVASDINERYETGVIVPAPKVNEDSLIQLPIQIFSSNSFFFGGRQCRLNGNNFYYDTPWGVKIDSPTTNAGGIEWGVITKISGIK